MARIVEVTDLSGSYASRLLVESGHEVIRVEWHNRGSLRYREPLLGGGNNGESSAYHHFLNAGKKSLGLDLDSSAGREIFLRLVAQADVLIANTPLAIEDAALIAANTKLVYSKIEDEEPDICAMARSGLMSLTGQPDQSPMVLGGDIAALATGIYVAVATAAGLHSVKTTGKGLIV
ncbi:MAG: CoA transferase, partial [Candidatus Binatia bacterium]